MYKVLAKIGTILSWVFGLLLFYIGAVEFPYNILLGSIYLFLAFFIFPPFALLIETKLKITTRDRVLFLSIILSLLFIWILRMPPQEPPIINYFQKLWN